MRPYVRVQENAATVQEIPIAHRRLWRVAFDSALPSASARTRATRAGTVRSRYGRVLIQVEGIIILLSFPNSQPTFCFYYGIPRAPQTPQQPALRVLLR